MLSDKDYMVYGNLGDKQIVIQVIDLDYFIHSSDDSEVFYTDCGTASQGSCKKSEIIFTEIII